MKQDAISKMTSIEKAKYFLNCNPSAQLITQWDEKKKDFVHHWFAKLGKRIVSLNNQKEKFNSRDEAIVLAVKYKKMCSNYLKNHQ